MRILVLIAILLHGHFVLAEQEGEVLLRYPESAAVDLGLGWDLHKGRSVPNVCIKNFEKYTVPKNTKEEGFEQGNNTWSLMLQLDIGAKQSLGYNEKVKTAAVNSNAGFSESSSWSVAAKYNMSRDNRYIIGKQKIVTSWEAIKSTGGLIELTDAAKKLRDEDPESFTRQCGHGYVARIEYGGNFHALFNLHHATYSASLDIKRHFEEKTYEKIGVDESSESGGESGSNDLDFKSSFSWDEQDIDIHVSESGGAPSAAGNNVDSVIEQYVSFPERAAEAPTEFMMAVFPYPESTPLSEIQAPYEVLAREYFKWLYLEREIGKMITAEHDANQAGYIFIEGVTASKKDLEYMQDMAGDKVDAIAKVAVDCIKYLNDTELVDQKKVEKLCSLKGLKVDFMVMDKKTGQYKKTKVDVLESDIYYLVRLPYSPAVFDGLFLNNQTAESAMSYRDLIFSQVNGVYRERCGNEYITHYCENESKIEQAVNNYIPEQQGIMYYKYRAFQDGKSCIAINSQGFLTTNNCTLADYFAIDHDTNQVRVRKHGNSSGKVDGCLRYIFISGQKYAQIKMVACEKSSDDAFKNYMSSWDLVAYRGDGKNPYRIIRDAYYNDRYSADYCLDVQGDTDKHNTKIINYSCKDSSSQELNQKWKQETPVFHFN